MKDIDTLFSIYSFEEEKLLAFGFEKKEEKYVYSRRLSTPPFEVRIVVNENKITADVFDAETGDVYALVKVPEAVGAFVGKIREEFETQLSDIRKQCCVVDVFKSLSARNIIRYMKNKYKDELEYLWPKFPKNAVFRRKDNGKWYAAILTVTKDKLGLPSNEMAEIIDLRGKISEIEQLVNGKEYFPGWHMNKKHWFTICLDGSVSAEEIYRRIDESYLLAGK
ncbi:MAG: MmcQ/YjbR family DNA-binding protein [Alphaproteobacteria bacterium]